MYCESSFQIDFGDGSGNGINFGNLDNVSTAEIDFGGITLEEGDIDWDISTVEPPGEAENKVF
jgi:hypothetical protein